MVNQIRRFKDGKKTLSQPLQHYCRYLLSSVRNFTLTHYADHVDGLSHDAINRHLRDADLNPSVLWERVEHDIAPCQDGIVVFDDTILDKSYSQKIEMARYQYSGNAHAVIKGIGVVNCLYVNPHTGESWVIDYRIYNPDADGKSKHDHLREMLESLEKEKQLPYRTVLVDSWYATLKLMLALEDRGKCYYFPQSCDRLVDDSGGARPYQRAEALAWSAHEENHGKRVKLKGAPSWHKVQLFRVVAANGKTDYIVTNDPLANTVEDVRNACGIRWKIEEMHRELKQLTGIERCQCRKAAIQRSHIACAMVVWTALKALARKLGTTVYQLKQQLYAPYLRKLLTQNHCQFA